MTSLLLSQKQNNIEYVFANCLKCGDELLRCIPWYVDFLPLLKIFRYTREKPAESTIMCYFCLFYVFLRKWSVSRQTSPINGLEKLLGSLLSYVERNKMHLNHDHIEGKIQVQENTQSQESNSLSLKEILSTALLAIKENTLSKPLSLNGVMESFSEVLDWFNISFACKMEERYVLSVPCCEPIPVAFFSQTLVSSLNVYSIPNSENFLVVSNPVVSEAKNLIFGIDSPSTQSNSSAIQRSLISNHPNSSSMMQEDCSNMDEIHGSNNSNTELDSSFYGQTALTPHINTQTSTPTVFTKIGYFSTNDQQYPYWVCKNVLPDQFLFLKGPQYHFFSDQNNNNNNNNNKHSGQLLVPLSFRSNFNHKKDSPEDQSSSYYWAGCMVRIVDENQSFIGFIIFFRISPSLLAVCNLSEDDFEDLPQNNIIDLANDEKCLHETTRSGLKSRFVMDDLNIDINELRFKNFQLADTDWCPAKYAMVHFYRSGSNMKEFN